MHKDKPWQRGCREHKFLGVHIILLFLVINIIYRWPFLLPRQFQIYCIIIS
jgi:hypothetical protein